MKGPCQPASQNTPPPTVLLCFLPHKPRNVGSAQCSCSTQAKPSQGSAGRQLSSPRVRTRPIGDRGESVARDKAAARRDTCLAGNLRRLRVEWDLNPGCAAGAITAPPMNQVAHAAGMRAATREPHSGAAVIAARTGTAGQSGRPTCANPITGDHLPTSPGRAHPALSAAERPRGALGPDNIRRLGPAAKERSIMRTCRAREHSGEVRANVAAWQSTMPSAANALVDIRQITPLIRRMV